ncbi:hypothetical protein WN48_10654 [Eufriesea mexicana]|uniref:Uncharacterized protein n=1 Tax=Eufriesea mexicana TaxID=516756 RepID=A0A310SG51_9HYME|nr:hypothetical protein WN48_10654 [Eufriesea mexicana]
MKLLVSTRGPCWAVAGQDRHFASQPHGVELNHPCGLTVDGTSPSASMCPSPSRVRLRQRTAPSRSEDALIRGGHPGTRCMTRLTVTGNECRRRVESFPNIPQKSSILNRSNSPILIPELRTKGHFPTPVAEQPAKPEPEERSCVETESIETGLRKTRIGPASPLRASPSRSLASSSGDRTPRAGSIVRENSNVSRASSGSRTPRDSNSSPEGSPLKRGTIRNSLRKPPTGSLSKASMVAKTCQSPVSGSNTWNGRQARQRPSIQSDTFLNPQGSATCATTPSFTRKSPARQSLPRQSTNGIQYDRNGRRIKTATGSLQSSPTKVANPLLEQILQKVGHLQDEREVVQKLQDLLRDYQAHGTGDGVANMEFTRAWIDGNGTVALPQDNQMTASPRKDPKPVSERGGFSRIPAPVYKRPMSVASDSVTFPQPLSAGKHARKARYEAQYTAVIGGLAAYGETALVLGRQQPPTMVHAVGPHVCILYVFRVACDIQSVESLRSGGDTNRCDVTPMKLRDTGRPILWYISLWGNQGYGVYNRTCIVLTGNGSLGYRG